MNIFVLSKNPRKAAKWLCDKHINKMIIESCQMLYIAIWVCWWNNHIEDKDPRLNTAPLNSKNQRGFARPKMFINHPCSKWVRESINNYLWLCNHVHEMCLEYQRRYNREHLLYSHVLWLLANIPEQIPKIPLTDFALAMPDVYKKYDTPVKCYRAYYLGDKVRFAKWGYSEIPWWYLKGVLSKDEKFINNNRIIINLSM